MGRAPMGRAWSTSTAPMMPAGTGLLRVGPGGDQLKGWPKTIRVFARRERPHPGAQLSLFEAVGG